jgi:hypothetical protein
VHLKYKRFMAGDDVPYQAGIIVSGHTSGCVLTVRGKVGGDILVNGTKFPVPANHTAYEAFVEEFMQKFPEEVWQAASLWLEPPFKLHFEAEPAPIFSDSIFAAQLILRWGADQEYDTYVGPAQATAFSGSGVEAYGQRRLFFYWNEWEETLARNRKDAADASL